MGERGALRTLEFLIVHIRNAHTRRAYHRAATRFSAWCTRHALGLEAVRGPHVAPYIEELARGELHGAAVAPVKRFRVIRSSSTLRPSGTGSITWSPGTSSK
jgi:site-specific recombinase XerD